MELFVFNLLSHSTVISIVAIALLSLIWQFHNESDDSTYSHNENTETNESVLLLINPKDRQKLRKRVQCATTTEDFFNIFNEFEFLRKLNMPVSNVSEEPPEAVEQAFRDLVRDKISINNIPIVMGANSTVPKKFKSYFHGIVKKVISDHAVDKKKRDVLATRICCYLSRTRSGGDSLFAVRDIFDSPQLIIAASHTDTHPPTELQVTDDGWATITSTSNFDVYLSDSLHAPDACGSATDIIPAPIVTLSVRLDEALSLTEKQLTDRKPPFSPPSSPCNSISTAPTLPSPLISAFSISSSLYGSLIREKASAMPMLLYRRMSIVCFDPKDPTRYVGGIDAF
mmetsp:Transcript_4040/g.6262  ORF Transcript_4040/g.6262 Transcript_4040/m.6262 type:complete len:341 (-) Transcript_4040:310-1332(-)